MKVTKTFLLAGLALTLPVLGETLKTESVFSPENLKRIQNMKGEASLEGQSLKFKMGTSSVQTMTAEMIPANPSGCLTLEAKGSGKGYAGFYVYVFDQNKKKIGEEYSTLALKEKEQSYKRRIRVQSLYKGVTPAFMRVGFNLFPRAQGKVKELKVDYQKKIANETMIPVLRQDWAKANCFMLKKQANSLKNNPPPVMFLGDSITMMWDYPANHRYPGGRETWDKFFKPMGAVNFGISGDTIQHVLWRITEGENLVCKPKVLVLMIGTNNLPFTQPDEACDGIENLVKIIQEKTPETKILLLGIFPRSSNCRIDEINALLKAMAAKRKIEYMDLKEQLLAGNKRVTKEIFRDGLHLSPKGYVIWKDAVMPKIKEMLGSK